MGFSFSVLVDFLVNLTSHHSKKKASRQWAGGKVPFGVVFLMNFVPKETVSKANTIGEVEFFLCFFLKSSRFLERLHPWALCIWIFCCQLHPWAQRFPRRHSHAFSRAPVSCPGPRQFHAGRHVPVGGWLLTLSENKSRPNFHSVNGWKFWINLSCHRSI